MIMNEFYAFTSNAWASSSMVKPDARNEIVTLELSAGPLASLRLNAYRQLDFLIGLSCGGYCIRWTDTILQPFPLHFKPGSRSEMIFIEIADP